MQLGSNTKSTGLLNLARCSFPLISPPSLLEDSFPSLCEHLKLSVLNTLHPVAEASTNTSKEGINPEGFLREDGAHFDSELPEPDGNACVVKVNKHPQPLTNNSIVL